MQWQCMNASPRKSDFGGQSQTPRTEVGREGSSFTHLCQDERLVLEMFKQDGYLKAFGDVTYVYASALQLGKMLFTPQSRSLRVVSQYRLRRFDCW